MPGQYPACDLLDAGDVGLLDGDDGREPVDEAGTPLLPVVAGRGVLADRHHQRRRVHGRPRPHEEHALDAHAYRLERGRLLRRRSRRRPPRLLHALQLFGDGILDVPTVIAVLRLRLRLWRLDAVELLPVLFSILVL